MANVMCAKNYNIYTEKGKKTFWSSFLVSVYSAVQYNVYYASLDIRCWVQGDNYDTRRDENN